MPRYPKDALYEELAYIAYHFHWQLEPLLEMEHAERHRWVKGNQQDQRAPDARGTIDGVGRPNSGTGSKAIYKRKGVKKCHKVKTIRTYRLGVKRLSCSGKDLSRTSTTMSRDIAR